MKAATEEPVFSGLVVRWPSLTGNGTRLLPRCSRCQSANLHIFFTDNQVDMNVISAALNYFLS